MKSNLNAYFHPTAAPSGESGTLKQVSSTGIQGKRSETSLLHHAERQASEKSQFGQSKTRRSSDLMSETLRHQKQAAAGEILASQEEDKHLERESETRHSDSPIYTEDEKFGLLSAYLDDEVSEEERCLVNHWLKSDSEMKQTYRQQLQIRAALKLLSNQSTEE